MFHFRRNPENLPVMSDGGKYRLAHPPARIRDKPHSACWIKARCGLDQAHIALVDEFVEGISRARALLRHSDEEAVIGPYQFSNAFLAPILIILTTLLFHFGVQLM